MKRGNEKEDRRKGGGGKGMNAPVPSVSRGSPWVDKGPLVCRRLLSRCASRCALCHEKREECSVRRTIGMDSTLMWRCLGVQRG